MVPVLHAGTPHRVSLRGFERSHPQLVCVLIREMPDGYAVSDGMQVEETAQKGDRIPARGVQLSSTARPAAPGRGSRPEADIHCKDPWNVEAHHTLQDHKLRELISHSARVLIMPPVHLTVTRLHAL